MNIKKKPLNIMENRFENFKMIEPLKKNRFIISFRGSDVPAQCFRNFKIYNEGENIIFETSIWQTNNFLFNPVQLFEIKGVKIEFLDPIGTTVNGLDFEVKGSNMDIDCSYSNDDISSVNFKFIVDSLTLKLIYKNS